MNKDQPQFNMAAVFTTHRGAGEPLSTVTATSTTSTLTTTSITSTSGLFGQISPPPSSVTPEIDAVDDMMKWVKKNDADFEMDEDEVDDRDTGSNGLTVNDTAVNGVVMDRSFSIGDPPSLLGVNQFSRTLSTPLFSTSGNVIGLNGLGTTLTQQTAPRLTHPSDSSTVKDDPFHFGGAAATLTKPGPTDPLSSSSIDTMGNLGFFGTPLTSHVDSKPTYPSLGQGFSLTPPPSTEPSVYAPSATIPFHIVPLGSLPQTASNTSSSTSSSSASSSPPQMQLLFAPQQLSSQPQPQPKLQPPQIQPTTIQPQSQPTITAPQPQPSVVQPQPQIQPPQLLPPTQQPQIHPPTVTTTTTTTTTTAPSSSSSTTTAPTASTGQTRFVGTAAVFVPKSMMAPSSSSAIQNEVPSTGGVQYPIHKDFGSYSHPGVFSSEPHNEISFPPSTTSSYGMDSSSPPQVVGGINGTNYRTKVCWYYVNTGHCQKGDRCNFSHHPPVVTPNVPPNMYMPPIAPYPYGGVLEPSMSGSPRTMEKSNGIGPYGVPPNPSQTQPPPAQQVVQPPTQPTPPANFVAVQQLYRTKPCRFFFEKGTCLKGDRCNFSHDPAYAAAYADANPNSGFQMPDMSRFTGTTSSTTSANSGSSTVPSTNGRTTTTAPGTTDSSVRGGSRHQQTQPNTSSTSPATSTAAASRLSSASTVDFPPLG